jgi:uncharacterized protein YkwD
MSCATDDFPDESRQKRELMEAINKLRSNGCLCGNDLMVPVPILVWNNVLETTAHDHAMDMYTNSYFSHISQDGRAPINRALDAGYEGEYVGETLALGFKRVDDVVRAWVESEDHCKAIMDPLYLEAGASRVKDYWVLNLGKPN